ncbi:uncharacterized protein LOC120294898 [Eucalyptus grandis]|uniref:uncharacterized protein LOC120294898 n=1 Tax=Eucalyptus grandis TaxID=71139 RepID=UPI00192E7E88|nr:uncharacterized protein LOC120294898 [Eucalyptus grandis]
MGKLKSVGANSTEDVIATVDFAHCCGGTTSASRYALASFRKLPEDVKDSEFILGHYLRQLAACQGRLQLVPLAQRDALRLDAFDWVSGVSDIDGGQFCGRASGGGSSRPLLKVCFVSFNPILAWTF